MIIKRFLPLLLLLVGLANAATAQGIVQEGERQMSKGTRPGFRLDFPKTDLEMVEKMWKSFVKTTFDAKAKKDKNTGELVALGMESGLVANGKSDLYSRLDGYLGDGATLLVWFDTGDHFLNRSEDPNRVSATADALKQFYYSVRRAVIQKEQDAQADRVKEAEKALNRLRKDNANLLADIEDYKMKIRKAEEEIQRNQQAQTAAQLEIENQQRILDAVRQRMQNVEQEH